MMMRPPDLTLIAPIQDDSEDGHRESDSGVQYRAFTGDLINRDANLESSLGVLAIDFSVSLCALQRLLLWKSDQHLQAF